MSPSGGPFQYGAIQRGAWSRQLPGARRQWPRTMKRENSAPRSRSRWSCRRARTWRIGILPGRCQICSSLRSGGVGGARLRLGRPAGSGAAGEAAEPTTGHAGDEPANRIALTTSWTSSFGAAGCGDRVASHRGSLPRNAVVPAPSDPAATVGSCPAATNPAPVARPSSTRGAASRRTKQHGARSRRRHGQHRGSSITAVDRCWSPGMAICRRVSSTTPSSPSRPGIAAKVRPPG